VAGDESGEVGDAHLDASFGGAGEGELDRLHAGVAAQDYVLGPGRVARVEQVTSGALKVRPLRKLAWSRTLRTSNMVKPPKARWPNPLCESPTALL